MGNRVNKRREQNTRERVEVWKVLLVGATQAVLAWTMAAIGWVYPPVPMFLAALLAGVLYHGRPSAAARGGLWSTAALGWLAELAYVSVRTLQGTAIWETSTPWEGFWLAVAEVMLYAALLSFFSAFIAWGTSSQVRAPERPAPAPARSSSRSASRDEVPFDPHDEDTAPSPSLPMFRPEPQDTPGGKAPSQPNPKPSPKA